MTRAIRIGVDVGGTNTDAAALDGQNVLATSKRTTTADVTGGIVASVCAVMAEAEIEPEDVLALMIGTTQFLNAAVERRDLQRVGVLRLCGPATRSLPPMIDWPNHLRDMVDGEAALVGGGYEFDGRPISPLDPGEIRSACRSWAAMGITAVAINSVFAPVKDEMEIHAARIVNSEIPGVDLSLSHRIGHTGLLQREGATILNAALMGLSKSAVDAFQSAFSALGLACPLYLTQNDGTLMSADLARRYPVFTISSGPTNSMRGASFLTGHADRIVIDIGGTTTDVGMLVGGFPRTRGLGAEIAGIKTNFRVPDVHSFGLGGGSVIRQEGQRLTVGPESVGHGLTERARVFGGDVLTATDLAVAAGFARLGNRAAVADLDPAFVERAFLLMKSRIENAVDRMKPAPAPMPAVLVGGGSILVDGGLEGCSEVVRPPHFESANAIGAAIAQVSGEIDRVVSLDGKTRDEALAEVIAVATNRAIEAGADADSVEVAELTETPLAYLPGNAVRIAAKAVGNLAA